MKLSWNQRNQCVKTALLVCLLIASFAVPTLWTRQAERAILATPKALPKGQTLSQNNLFDALPQTEIDDVSLLLTLYYDGTRTKIDDDTQIALSPLLVWDSLAQQVDILATNGMLPDTDFTMQSKTAYWCALGDMETLFWHCTLTDQEGNTLNLTYHAGMNLVIAFAFHGAFSIDKQDCAQAYLQYLSVEDMVAVEQKKGYGVNVTADSVVFRYDTDIGIFISIHTNTYEAYPVAWE